MKRSNLLLPLAGVVLLLSVVVPLKADFPTPSPFPISWELTLTHSEPKRILVQGPGDSNPVPYWYMTYHVVNNTDKDKVLFYPSCDMVLEDGTLVRSDKNIAPAVFDAIKKRERLKYLLNADVIGGDLRQGEDQSKDGVAIWLEPRFRMGTFNIFLTGFWGETATVKVGDSDVTLRKSLQLGYHFNSDEQHPGTGEMKDFDPVYVMR